MFGVEIGLAQIIIILVILFLSWGARSYFQAKKLHSYYSEVLKKSGLKYQILPFNFFSMSFVKRRDEAIAKYGDSYYFRKNQFKHNQIELHNVFSKVYLVLAQPQLLKAYFSPQKVYLFEKDRMVVEAIVEIFGQGIVFSQGHTWKNKRRLFSKVFNYELLKANISKIATLCDKNLDLYEKKHQISQGKYSFFILQWNTRVMIGFMLTAFFGCGEVDDDIRGKTIEQFIMGLMKDASQISLNPLIVFFGIIVYRLGLTGKMREIKSNIAIIRNLARSLIEKRSKEIAEGKRSKVKTDLVESLYEEKEKNKSEGKTEEFEYTTEDLIDQFCTFLVAGTDTTSHLLMMMVYYVCDNPRVEERLRKEINEVIKTEEDYTFENLKKLEYIDWIQLETTRYYGPGTLLFMRKALKQNNILNIPIIKGMSVVIQLTGIHYNQKYFKDPHQFRPERWQSQCDGLHPFALLGFGGGPKTCIGKHLAFLESKIMLIKLFKRYSKINVQKQRVMKLNFIYEPNEFNTIFEK